MRLGNFVQRCLQKLEALLIPQPDILNNLKTSKLSAPRLALTAPAAAVLEVIGGIGNVLAVSHIALTRVRIVLHQPVTLDHGKLQAHGIAVMPCNPQLYHLIAGTAALSLYQSLSDQMRWFSEAA